MSVQVPVENELIRYFYKSDKHRITRVLRVFKMSILQGWSVRLTAVSKRTKVLKFNHLSDKVAALHDADVIADDLIQQGYKELKVGKE